MMNQAPAPFRALVFPTGSLVFGTRTVRAALGRGGVSAHKREGDGATPSGLLPLRAVLYRPDRVAPPRCAVPIRALAPADGWCDDPGHASYNTAVRLPLNASAEALWRDDGIYDIIGVLGWNDSPPEPGMGSAIFLHAARPDYAPTDGCVALARDDLVAVLDAGLTEILVADPVASTGVRG
jgi:L,D-peptidoglycan transpeptidase YkuD (ErfK/YbiS/YcfS/YnhG family)